jgi:hypothetical protein
MEAMLARVVLLSLSLLAALLAPAAADDAPTVTVAATDPAAGSALGRYGALYIRFTYSSPAPIRVQARGYRDGKPVDAGASFNPAPPYPAGAGEGIAWVAYDTASFIDEVRLDVFDAAFKPVKTVILPARFAWVQMPEEGRQRADWAARLSSAQQQAVSTAARESNSSASDIFVGGLVMLAVPGYFVLQFLTTFFWRGRWRLASLLPLIVMVPAAGHASFALAAGSNLWPILVILAAPFALLYLVVLGAAWGVMRAVPRPS